MMEDPNCNTEMTQPDNAGVAQANNNPPPKHGFQLAFEMQNRYINTAITSLDTLNDQIVQFLFSPQSIQVDFENDLSAKDREALQSSMTLMRQLLQDAQSKFRKMVEDNKKLAARIDNSIVAANEEVNVLRGELVDTNRRLSLISEAAVTETGKTPPRSATAADPPPKTKTQGNNSKMPNNDLALLKQRSKENEEEIFKLRSENSRLEALVKTLRRELDESRAAHSKTKLGSHNDESKVNELKLDLIQTKQELNRAKEALQAMKADRKRLKAEKLDLLSQMKQLYCTLEDKESELRDFIRNYEQRMRESDVAVKQLAQEKEESEREKWEILQRARETSERCMEFKTEVDLKNQQIKKLEVELAEAQDKLSGCSSSQQLGPLRSSVASDATSTSLSSPGPGLPPCLPSGDELPPYTHTPPPEPPGSATSARSNDSTYSTCHSSSLPNGSAENVAPFPLSPPSRAPKPAEPMEGVYVTIQPRDMDSSKKKKRRSLALSKVFGKSRSRRSIAVSDPSIMEDHSENASLRLTTLSEDNYQEKLGTLVRAKEIPMSRWKAGHVLSWLEIEVNMPMYGKYCAENIKSGKVLMGLSDSELDSAFNIQKPLHRRKLRLAIEEQREPAQRKYPKCGLMDHTWVAHRWIKDCGLPQYAPVLEEHLVDGRLLNALTKKDLEKHLGIHRKFHQVSILHAVQLLRHINFDKEVLNERRCNCDETDTDPIVWSNERLIKWICNIDLQEYADHLKETGVHGAVLVLEPTFNAESLANALGIPPSKSYVRRHLATELDCIVKPARAALDTNMNSNSSRKTPRSAGGSVGRSFTRSFRGPNDTEDSFRGSSKRLSFRGSIGRAFGRKVRSEMSSSDDASPASSQHYKSLRESPWRPHISAPVLQSRNSAHPSLGMTQV